MAGIIQMQKAQGATEYLVIMSVVLGIALICVAILVWPTGSTKDVKNSQTDIKCGIAKNAVPDIMQGLVAYYKFDEGSGTLAYDRKTGTSGTLGGGNSSRVPTWTIGKSGQALEFDGTNDFVQTSNDYNSPAATWSVWIKVPSFSADGAYSRRILGQSDGSGDHELTLSTNVNGRVNWLGYSTYYIWALTYSNLSTNTWHHIVGTYDGTTAILYINGQQANSSAQNDSIGTATADLYIGRVDFTPVGHFYGTIDEVILYNRALSADEIKFLSQYPGCP